MQRRPARSFEPGAAGVAAGRWRNCSETHRQSRKAVGRADACRWSQSPRCSESEGAQFGRRRGAKNEHGNGTELLPIEAQATIFSHDVARAPR